MASLQLAPAPRARTQVILIGTDLSEGADSALTYALNLASELSAAVLVVHVVEHIELKRGRNAPLVRKRMLALSNLIDGLRSDAERELAKQLRRVGTSAARTATEVVSGRPASALLSIASKKKAMLLVLGSAEPAAGLGQVAQRVLRAAPCPVVIVPASELPRRPVRGKPRLHLVQKPSKRK